LDPSLTIAVKDVFSGQLVGPRVPLSSVHRRSDDRPSHRCVGSTYAVTSPGHTNVASDVRAASKPPVGMLEVGIQPPVNKFYGFFQTIIRRQESVHTMEDHVSPTFI
jgi:hypothetical protein